MEDSIAYFQKINKAKTFKFDDLKAGAEDPE